MIDESKLDRLKIVSNVAAALCFVVFIGLAAYSAIRLHAINTEIAQATQTRDELQKQAAEFNAQAAALQSQVAALETRSAELQKRAEELQKTEAALKVSVDFLESVLGRVAKENKRVVERAAVASTTDTALRAEEVQPLVYLHITDEAQRPRAQALADKLRERGYVVPSIENVGKQPNLPENNELRLFSGSEQKDQEDLVALLGAEGIESQLVSSKVVTRPRQYEFWFGTKTGG